jgi:hypothetical protein
MAVMRGARAKPGTSRREPPPWWLDADVPCGSCAHWHAHGIEVRCARCDDAVCIVCIVQVRGRYLCPGCAPRGRR